MRKSLLLAATLAASAMLVLAPAGSALAAGKTDVLTTVKVGGHNVKVKDVLQTGLKPRTVLVFTQIGVAHPISLKCAKSTITSKVVANPVKPGTAVESITGETVTACKANTTLVQSVTVKATKLPYKVTASDAKGFPVTVFAPAAILHIVPAPSTKLKPFNCIFTAKTIKGSFSNTGSLTSFSKQVFTLQKTGSGIFCPAKGALTATYGPVVDLSVVGHPHVFVN